MRSLYIDHIQLTYLVSPLQSSPKWTVIKLDDPEEMTHYIRQKTFEHFDIGISVTRIGSFWRAPREVGGHVHKCLRWFFHTVQFDLFDVQFYSIPSTIEWDRADVQFEPRMSTFCWTVQFKPSRPFLQKTVHFTLDLGNRNWWNHNWNNKRMLEIIEKHASIYHAFNGLSPSTWVKSPLEKT